MPELQPNPFAVQTLAVEVPRVNEAPISFHVRGVSVKDLSVLLQTHGAAMAVLYHKYVANDSQVVDEKVDTAMGELINTMPDLVADLIARVTDGEIPSKIAVNLPLPVQTDALVAISRLTFVGEGALEKFLATGAQMLSGLTVAVQKASTLRR